MDSMRLTTVAFSSSSSWLSASRWRRSWSSAGPRASSLNTREMLLTESPASRLLQPRRIASLGVIAEWGRPDRLTDVLVWLVFALVLGDSHGFLAGCVQA